MALRVFPKWPWRSSRRCVSSEVRRPPPASSPMTGDARCEGTSQQAVRKRTFAVCVGGGGEGKAPTPTPARLSASSQAPHGPAESGPADLTGDSELVRMTDGCTATAFWVVCPTALVSGASGHQRREVPRRQGESWDPSREIVLRISFGNSANVLHHYKTQFSS